MSYHNSTLQNTSVHVPGVPSDDDLYDAGWAKHWDPNRNAYYYYPIDGSAPTTWENPLRDNDASTYGGHASFAGASLAASFASGLSRHRNVASIKEETSDDDNSSASTSSSALEASFFGESAGDVSLTLSALMGSRRTLNQRQASMKSPAQQSLQQQSNHAAANSLQASVHALQKQQSTRQTQQSQQMSQKLQQSQQQLQQSQPQQDFDQEESETTQSQANFAASQGSKSIGLNTAFGTHVVSEASSNHDDEDEDEEVQIGTGDDDDQQQGEGEDDEYDSFVTEETPGLRANTTTETFDDEPVPAAGGRSTGTASRSFGGTPRKPLRMPRPKKPTSPKSPADSIDWEAIAIDKEIQESEAEMKKRRAEYLELYEQDQARFNHRKAGPAGACIMLILILAGMGVGGYFLGTSLVKQAEELAQPANVTTPAPTTAPLTLPDYTQETLQNPVSEQARALNWLRDDPNYASYSKEEKEARFALMTIYTATGGSSWGRSDSFLLPESAYQMASHCDFPYYTCPGWTPSVTFAPIPASTLIPAPATPPPTPVPGANGTATTPPAATPIPTPPGGTTIAPGTNATTTGTTPPAPATSIPTPAGTSTSTTTAPAPATAIPTPPGNGTTAGTIPPAPAPGGRRLPMVSPPTHTDNYWNQHQLSADHSWNQLLQQRHQRQQAQAQAQQQHRQLYFDATYADGAILNLTNQGLLQGTLPPEMALLTELETVQVSNNLGLIGSIPDSIRFWEDFLFTLILTGNSLSGTIPTIMGQLRHVRTLHLNDNQFTGPLPDQLSLLSQMTSLRLQNNQLTGTVPLALAQYAYVHEINWSGNRLSGPLPTFYVAGSQASQVRMILLANNSFSGTIPTELGGLSNLEVLQLHNNLQLVGGVPTEICALPNLIQLTVDCNNVACGCAQCQCPTGGNPRNANLISSLPTYTQTAIAAGNTPQSLAYTWLTSDSALSSYPLDQQLQRYALACLYYATNKAADNYQNWALFTDWLDKGAQGVGECMWANTSKVFYRVPDVATDSLPNCISTTSSGGETLQSYQSLRLSNNTLEGTLPPQVAMLTHLRKLELHNNRLMGSIPTYLSALTALNVLDLEGTSLTGTVPTQLLGLPQLNKLYLGANSLVGTLPTELGTMSVLDLLQLNDNQFNGTLPTELALLALNLQRLYLSANTLTGTLQNTAVGSLTSLVDLYLDGNDLVGNLNGLPFTTAPSLAHVVVSNNALTGTIPTLFGSMASIQVLLLDRNQFVGPIPVELTGAAITLQWLHLSSNLLTGSIPTEVGQLGQLIEFHVANNKLQGTIPTQLNQCVLLRSLDLSTNRLNGPIPPELRFLPSLTKLKIDHNDLTGNLPTQLSGLSSTLNWMDASWNALAGALPTELALLTNLEWLYLERNNLNGPIPPVLAQLTRLKELSMYGMQLGGSIPSELGLLTSLTGLFLHENYLEGSIPSELGLLTQLTSLWLHQLSLTGTVPAELCSLFTTGTLQTLAVDCLKVACTCGCSCPTEGGDAPRTDPTLAARTTDLTKSTPDSNIFRHRQGV